MSNYLLIALANKTKVVCAVLYCSLLKLFLTQISKKQTKKPQIECFIFWINKCNADPHNK